MNHELMQAARDMQAVLMQETAAARRASLAELAALFAEKQDALAVLEQASTEAMPDEACRAALRAMLAAAEENAMVLGAVAGAMESVQDRLRTDLAEAANPGTYGPQGGGRRAPRHSLAASINQTA